MHIVNKICTLADGSDIKIEKIVVLPVKISNVTYNVKLYILPVKHLNMIIGCDLLTRLAATIDYKHNVLVIENCGEHDTVPCTSEDMLGQLEEIKSKSVDLLSTGNHWLRPGYSCNMVLKTNKNIDYVSENTIMSKLPLHIKLEDTLKSNKEVITKVTNYTTTPILIMDKENIATLQDKDLSKIDNVRVSLNDKIKDIDLSSSDIKDYQKEELIRLLNNFTDVFSTNLQEIGRTNLIECDVEVDLDVKPIRLQQYKCPYKHRAIIEQQITELLDADLIRPAKTMKWGHPVILAPKPRSSKLRMCCDVRRLNKITKTLSYPLELPNFLADIGSKKCNYFSCIDLKSAYNQIPLSKRSQEICTFTCVAGDYSPTTAMFGLKNLPHVFSRLMDLIFQDIKYKYMGYYQDDLIIFSETFSDHLTHIREVLSRLRRAGLTAEPKKTNLCQLSVGFLGYTLSKHGVYTANHNIEKVKQFQPCKSQRDCRTWLCLCYFYRRFLKGYSVLAKPILDLTKKQDGMFKWNKAAQLAFETIRDKLISAPVLAYPEMSSDEPFVVTVDTSSIGIGYTMSQRQFSDQIGKIVERPILYGGTNLKNNETKY